MSVIQKNGRREQTYFLMDLFCVTGRPLHSITFIALTNETEFKAGDLIIQINVDFERP